MTEHDDDYITLIPARPSRADAVRNRELLLETASRLFEEQGVEAVSMTQLAQAAGVGKGTLYRHFNNKTDVCYALLDQEQRDLQSRTLERLKQVETPYENLRWFLEAAASFVIRHDEMLAAAMESSHTSSLEFPAHEWWRQTIRGLLQRLDLSGDLDYTSDVLYVMLDIRTIYFQRRILGYKPERIMAGLLSTLDRLLGL